MGKPKRKRRPTEQCLPGRRRSPQRATTFGTGPTQRIARTISVAAAVFFNSRSTRDIGKSWLVDVV